MHIQRLYWYASKWNIIRDRPLCLHYSRWLHFRGVLERDSTVVAAHVCIRLEIRIRSVGLTHVHSVGVVWEPHRPRNCWKSYDYANGPSGDG